MMDTVPWVKAAQALVVAVGLAVNIGCCLVIANLGPDSAVATILSICISSLFCYITLSFGQSYEETERNRCGLAAGFFATFGCGAECPSTKCLFVSMLPVCLFGIVSLRIFHDRPSAGFGIIATVFPAWLAASVHSNVRTWFALKQAHQQGVQQTHNDSRTHLVEGDVVQKYRRFVHVPLLTGCSVCVTQFGFIQATQREAKKRWLVLEITDDYVRLQRLGRPDAFPLCIGSPRHYEIVYPETYPCQFMVDLYKPVDENDPRLAQQVAEALAAHAHANRIPSHSSSAEYAEDDEYADSGVTSSYEWSRNSHLRGSQAQDGLGNREDYHHDEELDDGEDDDDDDDDDDDRDELEVEAMENGRRAHARRHPSLADEGTADTEGIEVKISDGSAGETQQGNSQPDGESTGTRRPAVEPITLI